jgi:predicted PurR-regulated permease PerM
MLSIFNDHLRQIILLSLIIILGVLLLTALYIFLPGFLGGVTLYILTRKGYNTLTIKKKWNKGFTAVLFIIGCIIIIAIPVYFSVRLISPKINSLINNQQEVILGLEVFSKKVETYIGQELFTAANAESIAKKIFSYAPSFLNSTANIVANVFMMFFLLYYLLFSGKVFEKYIGHIIPLKPENVEKLASETTRMVTANALGIPIISIVHGVVAGIGYLVFGVNDWGLWAFMTGVFAFFPFVGIMIVWVPLVIYLFSINQNFTAIGLALYSTFITGNVDYIARFGLLKQIGNIHPMITVLGVIVGLKLFGFMGLIFGPLLISYFIILIKIYMNEFAAKIIAPGATNK